MERNIRQCGIIESIDGNRARISTVRSSACDSCEANRTCKSGIKGNFYVDVCDERLATCKPGDRVYIEMPTAAGRQAVLVGFGLPLIVFVATLLALHYCGVDDVMAAMWGIGALVVYYLIIYILRRRVDRHFTIRLAEHE